MILLPGNRAFPNYLKILDLRIPLHRKVGKAKKNRAALSHKDLRGQACPLKRHTFLELLSCCLCPTLSDLLDSEPVQSFRSNRLLRPSPGPRSG